MKTTRLTMAPVVVLMAVLLATAVGAAREPEDRQSENRFFSEKIEPLLRDRCFTCHSHDATEMEGGLTLDSRSGWEKGGDRGPAIVPGEPEKSLLIKAVGYADEDLQMPPDGKLPEKEIELLVEWVRRGAADPRKAVLAGNSPSDPLDWWSLRPLKKPDLPALADIGEKHSNAVANAIDLFVLRQLDSKGLVPAPKADRRSVIRRLYFDLHGLPPTPEEVSRFVADPDPRAYEKLVDQLLDSPRYGERWARHWLDTVHFADSHGCEHDIFRPNAWRYRDYVIQSLNQDTRWARFVREQLAADWFYPEEPGLAAALGFIAAGPLELSRAGTAPVTFDYLDRDDIVTQTMGTFASTTANCARCHNHKFDPISQEDYYALQAVFAGAGKGDLEYDVDPAVASRRNQLTQLLALAKKPDASKLLSAEYESLIARWEAETRESAAVWEPLTAEALHSADGSTLKRLADDSVLASEQRPDIDTYTIHAPASLSQVTALRLDVLADDSLPMKGPGRYDNGNFHLNEIKAFVLDEEASQQTELKIARATADWNQEGWTIAHSLDGDPATGWGIFPKVGESHHAVFELVEPVVVRQPGQIVIQLDQHHGGGHLIGRFKLYATGSDPAAAVIFPDAVQSAMKTDPQERTDEQRVAIASYVLAKHAEAELALLPKSISVYGWSRNYSHGKKLDSPLQPKIVHVLNRGDIERPGAVAVPGSLSALEGLSARFELEDPNDEASRRAALAEWFVADDNPLAWRSIVNRVWSYHFARGLSDTPNDFGRMGGIPSHPELLDWLAIWFRDEAKGSFKELHRLILLSETWQRSSRVPLTSDAAAAYERARTVDANNRLLWRQNRRSIDAESLRDSLLQISGRIDLTMGGPGVQQFTQSPGQQGTPQLHYDAFDWKSAPAARRSIYRVVWRGIADPFMESLDFPDLGLLSPKREFSVSPLQALTLFNNDFVLHHSQVLAEGLATRYVTQREQVTEACRLILLREPQSSETELYVAYAEKHRLAALCRVLFNSNAFIFID